MSISTRVLRLGTRQSQLALWQAEHVRERLQSLHANLEVELHPMTTSGDEMQSAPLARIGGKGLFLKEIEVALLDGRIDLAVHSAKDVPVTLEPEFVLGAICSRADVRDAWVSTTGDSVLNLAHGARVGTSSLRRVAQLRALRPDFDIQPIRGNVGTRLGKLRAGEFDALVLACAGLDRLGLAEVISARLSPADMLPASGQGALAVECRSQDLAVLDYLAALDDPQVRACVTAERALAGRLGADCTLPLAAQAQCDTADGEIELTGVVGDPRSGELLREQARAAGPEAVAALVAQRLLDRGAAALIERAADYE